MVNLCYTHFSDIKLVFSFIYCPLDRPQPDWPVPTYRYALQICRRHRVHLRMDGRYFRLIGNHPELLRTKNDDCPYSNQPFFGMRNHRLDTSTQVHIIANCLLLLSPFYYLKTEGHGRQQLLIISEQHHKSCHHNEFVPLPDRPFGTGQPLAECKKAEAASSTAQPNWPKFCWCCILQIVR